MLRCSARLRPCALPRWFRRDGGASPRNRGQAWMEASPRSSPRLVRLDAVITADARAAPRHLSRAIGLSGGAEVAVADTERSFSWRPDKCGHRCRRSIGKLRDQE